MIGGIGIEGSGMRVTEAELRANYEALETERLLELQARGTLTEAAARVLEQILRERSVPSEERVRIVSETQKRIAEKIEEVAALASRGERAGAQLIDTFVALAVLVFCFLLSIVVPGALMAGYVLSFAYLLWADGLPPGQSLGKRALGIAVIDERTTKPCTYSQSFLRNLSLLLLGIIDWLCILGRTRQRLGDMAARTRVVRLGKMPNNGLPATCEDARA